MVKRPMIYVAGPITKGDHPVNIRNGVDAMAKLLRMGFVPFVPMLDFLVRLVHPDLGYEDFLDYDFQVIARCDAVFRIPGDSAGADREEKFARENNIPVFYDYATMQDWKDDIYGKENPKCCGRYS